MRFKLQNNQRSLIKDQKETSMGNRSMMVMFPTSGPTAKENNIFFEKNDHIPATFDHRGQNKDDSGESDVFQSDDCDEKRSYTPQPRQITMLGGLKTQASKLNRGMPNN